MLGHSLSHGCLSLHYNGELETVPDSAQLTDSGSINKWFKYIHLQNLNRYYNTQRGKSVKTFLAHFKALRHMFVSFVVVVNQLKFPSCHWSAVLSLMGTTGIECQWNSHSLIIVKGPLVNMLNLKAVARRAELRTFLFFLKKNNSFFFLRASFSSFFPFLNWLTKVIGNSCWAAVEKEQIMELETERQNQDYKCCG